MKRLLLILLLLSANVAAGPLEDGFAAFKAKDYARALQLWQPLAQEGNADAQYNLGLLYHKGWGVARDVKQAHEWYTRAANQGNTDAMYNLGVMYAYGLGTGQDAAKAIELWTQAADRGLDEARAALVQAYEQGLTGLAPDPARAKQWRNPN